ncbi:Oidioi.mRNA.OKI2018_I69.chr1.g103.t1.cds [Oikopleura dioica]|uniref:Oidioi.mRNA.OKI2018_I69.chr1.g103.t1.cds n=1 Tax=Oikopleura dioica TaxID=34765 RepID=A0ABN7SQ30_OIKDI|nr:Oidioi.mRNA.OKI2018_I69.chr1.g103.t1.cds [Oikopleura dioica]
MANQTSPSFLFGISAAVILISWIIMGNTITILGLIYSRPKHAISFVTSEKRKRITFNYLLSNSVADMLIGVFITPIALYQHIWGWPTNVPCHGLAHQSS